jgi:hypothetical protein
MREREIFTSIYALLAVEIDSQITAKVYCSN